MIGGVVCWASAALWVLLPLIGIAIIAGRSEGDDAPASVQWSPVGRGSAERAQRVALELTFGPTRSVFAPPGLAGLVQRVQVEPGGRLENGEPVATIGGLDRLGVVSAEPFSRTLQHGQAGPDVAALNRFLLARNLSADQGDRFGDATERGVIALSKQIGSAGTAVFDPSWFVFVPEGATAIAKVTIQPGMAAPEGGAPILDLAPSLVSASWTDPAGSSSASGSSAPELSPGAMLRVNGRTVTELTEQSTDDAGLVGADTLAELAAVLPVDAETADGVVVSAAPEGSVTVSAAAIYSDEAGQACVLWQSKAGSGTRRSKVTVVESMVGEAIVTGMPAAANRVQINPSTARRQRCP